jgi:predicted small lipoprotein YifL
MKKLVPMGAAALIAVSAAGCGRMADLDAPPAKRTERSLPSAQGPGPVEPATVYRPPIQQPIDGGPSSNPYGGSGAGPR